MGGGRETVTGGRSGDRRGGAGDQLGAVLGEDEGILRLGAGDRGVPRERLAGLDRHLDLLFSTHTFGYPKEDQRLWQAVQQHTGFNPQRTLFVDDGEPILDAARTFGIRYCLGVQNPDSSTAEKSFQRHPSMRDYRLLIPALPKGEA